MHARFGWRSLAQVALSVAVVGGLWLIIAAKSSWPEHDHHSGSADAAGAVKWLAPGAEPESEVAGGGDREVGDVRSLPAFLDLERSAERLNAERAALLKAAAADSDRTVKAGNDYRAALKDFRTNLSNLRNHIGSDQFRALMAPPTSSGGDEESLWLVVPEQKAGLLGERGR